MSVGLCAKWCNESVDFAISHNKWAVQFVQDDGAKVNLINEFAVTMWLRYITLMRTKPDATMNSAQLVLKYLLLNEKNLVRAWRQRIYRYSSGSTFTDITDDLHYYLKENPAVLLREVHHV